MKTIMIVVTTMLIFTMNKAENYADNVESSPPSNEACKPCDSISSNKSCCTYNTILNSSNIANYENCTTLYGDLTIRHDTFYNMHPKEFEVFQSVRKICGCIDIEASHSDFKDLHYFGNLRTVSSPNCSLYVFNTSLESLRLRSLSRIYGNVNIKENKQLCFLGPNTNWAVVTDSDATFARNRNHTECEREYLVCNRECSEDGCWGPGPDQCFRCMKYKNGRDCVRDCDSGTSWINETTNVCYPCHNTCEYGCTGPDDNQCIPCKIDGETCVAKCQPESQYEDNGKCKQCHQECQSGCTGPRADQCKDCKHFHQDERVCVEYCLKPFRYVQGKECKLCNEICIDGCTSQESNYNMNISDEVIRINSTVICVLTNDACPTGYFKEVITSQYEELSPLLNATLCRKCYSKSKCAPTETATGMSTLTIATLVIITTVATSIVLLVLYYYYYRIWKKYEFPVELEQLNKPEESTKCNPNLSQILIIKKADITKTKDLGRGAFGIVYQGSWRPDGKNEKVSVAIKVLHGKTDSKTTKQFLDESVIMATMDHPNVLHLIGICMSTELMLITQLMPLGCLLTYVRKHKKQIESKALLTWCAQIADGMAYLEEKRLVHIDLAARNVLLDTVHCAKITDFGLAKFLDVDKQKFESKDGKFPTKWLALECIEKQIFTHKSDVWAFGVTVWEVLTFGEIPYNKIANRQLLVHLREGVRLPQPSLCSAELYVLMVRCWTERPDMRPDFEELAGDFQTMLSNPGRYVANVRLIPAKTMKTLKQSMDKGCSSKDYDPKDQETGPSFLPTIVNSTISSSSIDPDGYLVPTVQYVQMDSVTSEYDTIINLPLTIR